MYIRYDKKIYKLQKEKKGSLLNQILDFVNNNILAFHTTSTKILL